MAADSTDTSRALERVAKSVKNRKCILFLGAAVNAGPPEGSKFNYPLEQRPPIGAELSEKLAVACDFEKRFKNDQPGNLQRVALAYEIQESRHDLVDAIAEAVEEGRAPSPMLHALAQLDFPIVITTNYDQLFERALIGAGKVPRVAVYNPERVPTMDLGDARPESPLVYKLHGDIADRGSLVVTDEDYIQFVLRMSDKEPNNPIPESLKVFLADWTTLFLGYSLLDYNLRLLFKTLRWGVDDADVPNMYSVDFRPDPLIQDVWQSRRRYVKFVAEDIWSFVPALYELILGEGLAP